MLSVEEALEKVLSHFSILETETKPLLKCLGQVLAEDVPAAFNIPLADNSAMDGYAVRAVDTEGASPTSPRRLQVIGEVAAGQLPQQEVREGVAVRIMTGAPLPRGADTIVPFEDTDEAERRERGEEMREIAIRRQARPGDNVRWEGEEVRAGQVVLTKGLVLRPAEIGVLANLGRAQATVVRRPVVSILATGDELVEPGNPLPPGMIYNSNSSSLAAQVLQAGAVPKLLPIARDTLEDLMDKVRQGVAADLLLTSAGVSVGYYDVVRDVLMKEGEIAFWSVRMRPGKPLAFGLLPGKAPTGVPKLVPHIGLPGNPVSSMVSFEQFARPAIRKMLGMADLMRPTVDVVLEEDIPNGGGRRFYARAIVRRRDGRLTATLTGPQGSNMLMSMALANALVIIPEDIPLAKAGTVVKAQMLDWSEHQSR